MLICSYIPYILICLTLFCPCTSTTHLTFYGCNPIWWEQACGPGLPPLLSQCSHKDSILLALPSNAICTAAGGRRQVAVPQHNPGAVLHLKVGFTQQSHRAVFLVIFFFPFLVLMKNCMSTATAWLSNAVNSSTEQEKYTQYAEAIQGTPLGSTVLLSACPGCFETSQQRGALRHSLHLSSQDFADSSS